MVVEVVEIVDGIEVDNDKLVAGYEVRVVTEAVLVETVVVKLVEGTVVVSVVVIGCVVLVVNVTAVDKKLLYYTYFDA